MAIGALHLACAEAAGGSAVAGVSVGRGRGPGSGSGWDESPEREDQVEPGIDNALLHLWASAVAEAEGEDPP